ncbi:hypothetical protein ACUF6G_000562 [Enterobacter hormaechei]|uniref:hypothetical protein n=1 Tax=Enterobacter hormaechei TaxID=158836 RepID=UPI0035D16F5D
MREKYSFIAVSTLLFSLNANAGLFDSTPDFKCGRDDAISAAQSKIRDDAVSKLQVAYLANPSDFYGKPLKDYIAKANEIAIVMANVTTNRLMTKRRRGAVARPSRSRCLLKSWVTLHPTQTD